MRGSRRGRVSSPIEVSSGFCFLAFLMSVRFQMKQQAIALIDLFMLFRFQMK
jgi:hypothetical protein